MFNMYYPKEGKSLYLTNQFSNPKTLSKNLKC